MAEYDYSKDNLVLDLGDDSDMEFDYERSVNPANLENAGDAAAGTGIRAKSSAELSLGLFDKKEAGGEVKFMAVRPWKGAIKEPSNAPKNNASAPGQTLSLQRVIGYHGWDQRNNIVYNREGHIVYPIAGVAVVLDPRTQKQRLFMGQNDDIICLAQSPADLNIIATGQVATIVNRRATNPHVCIWDSTDFKKCWTIKNAAQRAVRSLAFSKDGKLLATVGGDDNMTISVWDWQTGTLVAREKGDTNKIFQIKWSNLDANEFVTVGNKHVFFWTLSGSKLTKKKAQMGGKYPWQPFYTVAFSEKGYACCGAADGSVYVFVSGAAKKVVKVHSSKVYSLDGFAGGLVTGGANQVVVLDKTLTPIKSISFKNKVAAVSTEGSNLIVGTQGAEIFEVKNYAAAGDSQPKLLVEGHCDGELWGMAVHPDGGSYITAGEDNRVYQWDVKSHSVIRRGEISEKVGVKPKVRKAATSSLYPINQCARGVAISPDGKEFIVGSNAGEVSVFRTADFSLIATHDLNKWGKNNLGSQQWIQVIRYSPTGKTVAVASHGQVIVLLDVRDGYKPKSALRAHNSSVTHFDWSVDGTLLQANDMAYELLFHNIDENELTNSKQNTSATQTKDTVWATQSCILGWPVQGVFDPQQDGTDVNTVDSSPSRQLVVTGDDYGNINLYRFPVLKHNSHHTYEGHSAHVVETRFTLDEKHVISVGGGDKAIMVWDVNA